MNDKPDWLASEILNVLPGPDVLEELLAAGVDGTHPVGVVVWKRVVPSKQFKKNIALEKKEVFKNESESHLGLTASKTRILFSFRLALEAMAAATADPTIPPPATTTSKEDEETDRVEWMRRRLLWRRRGRP